MGYNNFNMKLYDGEKEYMTLRNWRELGDNEKKQFVDVRTKNEWRKTGVVRGAMLIELDKLDHDSEDKLSQLRRLSKRRLIVVNCGSGQRAKLAASILYRHGICPVILIEGKNFIKSQPLKTFPISAYVWLAFKKVRNTCVRDS